MPTEDHKGARIMAPYSSCSSALCWGLSDRIILEGFKFKESWAFFKHLQPSDFCPTEGVVSTGIQTCIAEDAGPMLVHPELI